jgi:hypothetical protein
MNHILPEQILANRSTLLNSIKLDLLTLLYDYLITWGWSLLKEFKGAHLIGKFSDFRWIQTSFPISQEPEVELCIEPVQSGPNPNTNLLKIHFNVILQTKPSFYK